MAKSPQNPRPPELEEAARTPGIAAATAAFLADLERAAMDPKPTHSGTIKVDPDVASVLKLASDFFARPIAELTRPVLHPYCQQLLAAMQRLNGTVLKEL